MTATPDQPARLPDSTTAMRILIAQIRAALPFDSPSTQRCSGDCQSCAMKLLEFLATEVEVWELRLAQGEKPNLADLARLAHSGRKIHRVLQRNGEV